VPRECTVCSHPESFSINEAIVGVGEEGKKSNRTIAKHYGVDHNAVQRHKQHIPELLLKASQALEVADADALLAKIEDLYAEAIEVLEAGKGEQDHRLVLSAKDRAGKQLETLAELRGELDRRPTVNIALVEHPDYKRLEDVLTGALEPYPAARYAVADALKELD
jgi:hypothetical protein